MFPSNRLVMHSGPLAGKTLPLEKEEVFIGRDLSNDIVINDPEVSRRHARLFLQGNNYVIEDLGSTNGTYVNGQRLMGPYVLRPGEVIVFGEHITALYEGTQPDLGSTVAAARSPAQSNPPQASPPVYDNPPAYSNNPPPPERPTFTVQQGYVGQVPDVEELEETPERRIPVWVLVVGALLLLTCLCIGFFELVDVTRSWCWLFGWLINIFSPGLCP